MRITLFTIGSRGDIQPYVALGLGLQAAGHSVRLAAHNEFERFIRSRGLDIFPVEGNPRAMLESDAGRDWLESANNPLAFFKKLGELSEQIMDQFLVDIWDACQETDAIIISPLAMPAAHVAEKLGLPVYAAYLQPSVPTRAFAAPMASGGRDFGGIFNRLSHVAVNHVFWQLFRSPTNTWRKETLGLPPMPFWGPYRKRLWRYRPVLLGHSPSVLPKPADWGGWLHVTGYWFLDHPAGWQPPADLVEFLDSGPPPVYVGFGSMNSRDPEATTRIVLKALARAGQRGVILTGWGGLDAVDLPESVFKIQEIPHDWLFPRTAAVVHHGGAGTTAAGLRAGIPSILIPFFADQPFWAAQVQRLGVGPKPIPRKQLSVDRLARAITAAVADQPMRDRAAELGRRIQAEDGVARAVEAFHRHLPRRLA